MAKKYFHEHALPIAAIFLLTAVLLGAGFYFGYSKGAKSVVSTSTMPSGDTVKADFGIFWEAWQKLRDNHVDSASTTDQELLYGSVTGAAGSFNDPHTVFFPPEEATKFVQDVSGSFGGIGAELGSRDGVITVDTPLKGNPAEKVGLKSGDYIVKIDNKPTDLMTLNNAVGHIRGVIGTPVTLTIVRKGWLQPRDFTLVRAKIVVPTLDLTMKENNRIADIQLYAFNENAPQMFADAAAKLVASGAKGIIIDLRNNPGGYLEVAQNLAGWFLEKDQLVVSERFHDGHEDTFKANGTGALKGIPIVILINQGSASAAEILAGALRDQVGAKIVGEKSYGKGTVQQLFPLKDGSSLKITIAHWVMPKGLILERNGIDPDVKIENTDDDIKAKKDPQLDKAIETLKAQMTLNKTQAVAK